jgi:hypothetical protein
VPRRPDLDDVACGLTIGSRGTGGGATFVSGTTAFGVPGAAFFLREKSGIARNPFFFIG